MESRKIYLSGGSTYVISLPKKWVQNAKLKQGDSVAMTLQDGSIIIEPGVTEWEAPKKEIKVSQVPSSDALERVIIANYLVGYDTLHINLDESNAEYRNSIKKALDFLVGAEIVEDTGDAITLEVLLDHKRLPTLKALQRAHFICKSMLGDVLKAVENGKPGIAGGIGVREENVDRLYFLVVRQLKSSVQYQQVAQKLGIKNQRDCLGYRIVVKSFERIADHITNIATNYEELSKNEENMILDEYLEFLRLVQEVYEKATSAIFRGNMELAEEVFVAMKGVRAKYKNISNQLFKVDVSTSTALHLKAILDSTSRIAGYSSDIAEIAINMSVEVP